MGVTPLAGVWIETPGVDHHDSARESHPSRVCGLKRPGGLAPSGRPGSHPSRVCGLKPREVPVYHVDHTVTPLAGVWIETLELSGTGRISQSHPSRVCGLKRGSGARSAGLSRHTPRGCVD